ncbi:MAG TPA: hypothetical protein DHV96_13925 [Lachnospiraceae bacterium]|nr:hypothetical protein [Lachnospiraceae bacterium]
MKNRIREKEAVHRDHLSRLIRTGLCLLTFALGMGAFGAIAYIVEQFGTGILWDPEQGYYTTAYFENALKQDVGKVLNDAKTGYWDKGVGKFSVIEIGENAHVYDYDMSLVKNAYEREEMPTTLAALNVYEKYIGSETRALDGLFCYYNKAYALLSSNKNKNAYLYLTKDTMLNLFALRGYRNTDYCVSSRFPEDAIFLFTDIQKSEDTDIQKTDSASDNSYYSYSMVAKGEQNGDEETRVYTTGQFPDLDRVGYLVYEPSTQMLYTPWNNYFKCEDEYIYSVDELLSLIAKYKATTGNTDSMLIPMTWAKNYTVQEIFTKEAEKQIAVDEAKNTFVNNNAFLFRIMVNSQIYSNVESVKQIKEASENYLIENGVSQETHSAYPIARLLKDSDIAALVDQLPSNIEIRIGINAKEASETNESKVVSGLALYSFYKTYGGALEAGMILCLILVIVQAVYGIRLEKKCGDKTQTNRSGVADRIPIELWCVLYLFGIACAGLVVYAWCNYFVEGQSRSLWESAYITAGSWLLLGVIVLLLVNGINHRIKRGNLIGNSWIRKAIQHSKIKRNALNGIERIMLATGLYMVCNGIFIFVYASWDGEYAWIYTLLLLGFVGIQIAAVIGIRRILTDGKRLLDAMNLMQSGELKKAEMIKERTRLFQELAKGLQHINDGLQTAVEKSLKDERMRTELITNVSHDLKTPLTSIINYINLLKEQEMPTSEAKHYVEVLDGKAQRLKHLTEDLVEAAKATSGNIELEMMPLALDELMKQSIGEFEDKYKKRNLTLVASCPEQTVMILADGRRLFRVMENILQNAYKYSMEGTRVYADLVCSGHVATFTLKNISAAELNISVEELMERFTRGDSARSTEGSGLGLSIARDLTRLQNGQFEIILDGDLFKVVITFPEYMEKGEKHT